MGFSEQANLSELHRLSQSKLQTVVAGDVAKVFPLLDVTNVDKTFGAYYDGMKQVITARRTVSSSLSASLYSGIRKDAGITNLFTPVLNSAINEKQLFTSLLVTGPISIKRSLAAGASIEQANANALTSTIRASQRHVANGGRGTIINAGNRDKSAKGWARLTDSKPCSFCAMLASRGPVYKSEGSSRFRSHDGCGCSAVPVFDMDAPWPGRAEEFRAEYDQNISGRFSGGDGNNDAVKAWKQYYDRKINPDAFNQARNVAEELVKQATAFETTLTPQMQALADKHGGTLEGLQYRLKEVDSLTRKIKKEVAEDVTKLMDVDSAGARMFDVNRYTMKLTEKNYVASTQAAVEELRAAGNTVKVKNYWLDETNPYQGINIQVTTPTGLKYELQFHTPTSLAIKEGELHTIYEKSRKTHDLIKKARYQKESFAAAAKIPVPRGIEGIASGLGTPVTSVVKTVKKVAVKKVEPKTPTAEELGKIGVDNPEMTALQDDNWLYEIREKVGFNAKPKLVSEIEMQKLESEGWLRTYRGLEGSKAPQFVEAYKTGDNFSGNGIFGSGTYSATDIKVARLYAKEKDENVLRLAISPKAKIIDITEANRLHRAYLEALAKERGINLDKLARKLRTGDDKYDVLMDVGRWATSQGYDVITVLHGEAGLYYNILNRGVVAVVK